MNVVHACVIPSGTHRGEVLIWDGNLTNVGVRAFQPWAIVNPYWPSANPFVAGGGGGYRFYNALESLPVAAGQKLGDFFCAGQRWLSDGRLFLAGGTRKYPLELPPGSGPVFEGAKFVYQWDATPTVGNPFGAWYRMADLSVERWYPTVTTDGTSSNRVLVLGGTDWQGSPGFMPEVNNYEAYLAAFAAFPPASTFEQKTTGAHPRLYSGPLVPMVGSSVTVSGFNNYPRILPLGVLDPIGGGVAPRLFVSGYWSMGFSWAHDPNTDPTYTFAIGTATQTAFIDDGTSLLYPAAIGAVPSLVLRIGGAWQTAFPGPSVPSARVESVEVTGSVTSTTTWSTGGPSDFPDLLHARLKGNVVILPNRSLFAVGGEDENNQFNLEPEYLEVGGSWKLAASHASPRDYHSVALLLPDARVFVAGGENSSSDYQIYEPEYLNVPATHRPQGLSVVNEISLAPISQDLLHGVSYGQSCTAYLSAPLPAGIGIEQAVLMAPAALTHHDDGGQRCIPLLVQDVTGSSPPSSAHNAVSITMPATERHAPPGWYMLFVLSSAGVPSSAYWVNLR